VVSYDDPLGYPLFRTFFSSSTVTLIGIMYPALNIGSPELFTLAQSNGLHPGASATFCRFFTAGFGFLVVIGGVWRLDTRLSSMSRRGGESVREESLDDGDGGSTSKSISGIGAVAIDGGGALLRWAESIRGNEGGSSISSVESVGIGSEVFSSESGLGVDSAFVDQNGNLGMAWVEH
jgi:hypothetical protein